MGTLADVARQLLIAWGERFRKLCPAGIEVGALVTAVSRGKLSVATLVPAGVAAAKSSKAPAELSEAVLRAWPVLMAVVREVNPRDTTAETELLKISVNAFDPTHAGSDPIENLVAPAFKEMSTKFGRYLANGGVKPTWKVVVELTAQETMMTFTLKSALPKQQAASGDAAAAAR